MAGPSAASIAIADDGELGGVREALRGLGHAFAEWKRPGPQPDASNPRLLFVCTVSRAVAASYQRRRAPGASAATWIAIATRESLSRRQSLIASGFDYLVRWPLHPGALHMLLASALYRGNEHRQVERLAVGHPVRIKLGRSYRPGALVDISPRGVRLFVPEELQPGQKVVLELPAELMSGRELVLGASVVRSRQAAAERGAEGEFSIGLRFDPLGHAQKNQLLGLLRRLKTEPATWSAPRPTGLKAPPRRPKRGRYATEVMAFSVAAGEWRLISGRNLSLGGMCADPHPALSVGKRVELAIEVGGASPLAVRAEVVRDAGESGVGLRFVDLAKADEDQLRALVDSLPAIEPLTPGARPAPLVAQLLGRWRRPKK
jgi:hypothetical protein